MFQWPQNTELNYCHVPPLPIELDKIKDGSSVSALPLFARRFLKSQKRGKPCLADVEVDTEEK